MKHLLILLSIFIFSSFLTSCEKKNGHGTETYIDKSTYVGEFKDGKYHGQGTYSYPDGRKKLGEFREGKDWNVIGYDQNGNEKIKWVNGKIEQ